MPNAYSISGPDFICVYRFYDARLPQLQISKTINFASKIMTLGLKAHSFMAKFIVAEMCE
jgi:hypothetical protein